ncbi:hypothetical protein QBC40DRAFT_270902 [Triangularia verruculosa]|uniref:Uncharacterized protein n=1 Tax=Triangularia verruculosa TaxID=2587418 RepID=A0AAN6XRX2_9PEZI|nr:hypothetical protein QBC40DRAFT_270902 [Triangularia verruculosa]
MSKGSVSRRKKKPKVCKTKRCLISLFFLFYPVASLSYPLSFPSLYYSGELMLLCLCEMTCNWRYAFASSTHLFLQLQSPCALPRTQQQPQSPPSKKKKKKKQ